MQYPIQLNTSFGMSQFDILQSQFSHHSNMGRREEFKDRCKEDLTIQEKYLEYFLDSDEMAAKYRMNEEDDEGFKIFNEHSDICSCLKFFAEKRF